MNNRSAMKPALFIPPATALLLIGGGISIQRQALGTLEEEHAFLLASISSAQSSSGGVSAPGKSAKDHPPVNWQRLGGQLEEMRHSGGTGDPRPLDQFLQRVDEMSEEELVKALEEDATGDLTGKIPGTIKALLIRALIRKNPERVFTQFANFLSSERETISSQFYGAFGKWAETDLAKATAWFDGQVAAGNFDSKSLNGNCRSRYSFEARLISLLLPSDPDAAFRRLDALGEIRHSEVLSECEFTPLTQDHQEAFMRQARERLSEEAFMLVMTRQSLLLVTQDGYPQVTGFLDRASATPAERAACVRVAAEEKIHDLSVRRKITQADIDTLRQWVGGQAPELTDSMTGSVISGTGEGEHKLDFAQAAELVLHYHDASDNDDTLCTFLESDTALAHKELAYDLAHKIRDDSRRAEMLETLK